MTRIFRGAQNRWLASLPWLPGILAMLLFHAAALAAQDNPKLIINDDCQVFDIASNNSIVYAVPHLKRIRRLVLERDDISVATSAGRTRQILDAAQIFAADAARWFRRELPILVARRAANRGKPDAATGARRIHDGQEASQETRQYGR